MEILAMSVKSLILSIAIASTAFFAVAEESPTPVGLEYCTVCHGSQLKGNANIGAPRLSGLPQWYIERQLLNFKSGLRGSHVEDERGAEMRPMVANLSEQELIAIAAWVAKTESSLPLPSLKGDIAAGKSLYQSCAACHGSKGEGNEILGAPKLTGLNDWYLATQLNHFRLNLRGDNKADSYGQQMKAGSVVITSEEDAANLASYITQLN
jgi:cytochrome c553